MKGDIIDYIEKELDLIGYAICKAMQLPTADETTNVTDVQSLEETGDHRNRCQAFDNRYSGSQAIEKVKAYLRDRYNKRK